MKADRQSFLTSEFLPIEILPLANDSQHISDHEAESRSGKDMSPQLCTGGAGRSVGRGRHEEQMVCHPGVGSPGYDHWTLETQYASRSSILGMLV